MSLVSAQNRIDAMMRAEIESIRAELAVATNEAATLREKLGIARMALELIAAPLPEDYGWSTKKAREALEKIRT